MRSENPWTLIDEGLRRHLPQSSTCFFFIALWRDKIVAPNWRIEGRQCRETTHSNAGPASLMLLAATNAKFNGLLEPNHTSSMPKPFSAVTIPRGEFDRHFPRVKSGKSTGRLRLATDRSLKVETTLHEGAS